MQASLHDSKPSLDFDDAFYDGEDNHYPHSFSSESIKVDLAANSDSWMEREENERAVSPALDSVSTLDINAGHSDTDDTQDEVDVASSQFVQISLSSSSEIVQPPEKQDEQQDSESSPTNFDIPYPNVIIDASKSPTHRVTLSTDSAQSAQSNTTATSAHDNTENYSRPPSAAGSHRSTKSLQLSSSNPPIQSPKLNVSSSAIPSATIAVAAGSSATSSEPSPQLPPPSNPAHRVTRSAGPSALERFRSKTRPSFLPPKPRTEDDKHMRDWEAMMTLSRNAAEKRRKALHERRLAREKKIEDSLSLWEKEILPDWRIVYKNPKYRKIWWRGIPTKLRATMWERAVGNPLALSKDNYRSCLSRAKRALTAGTFPAATLTLIDEDITSTLPSLHIFHHETGPLYSDLKDMLCAWVVSRSDEGLGYTFGAAKIAAMFLINMPPQQGFVVMRNLLERHCLRSFFGGDGAKADVDAYYRIFDTLLADGMPKIYFNFKQHQISPAAYLPDWLIPLFLDHLPFEACARIWDVIVLEGDSFLYRAALGILAVLEPRLFFPDRRELLELLQGVNKAAIEVAKREGAALDGGKYEIYGVDEETLWERIDGMEDWWKESTWNRLIQRELPDL
ncbi:RabGAP/TBC [Dendrothele bispora CBS 962.96]|uniref:RabGAP/TBC n=1 Tax=Dendrothele bispora (strain CBS 962.96) TaxID=1314807 RepID=A0A4S8MYC3_DENBC|nr:RabGAP/TBC [Dendrothele bispora CBS 962.96]